MNDECGPLSSQQAGVASMKECFDIRADEDWAEREFGDQIGTPMSFVRATGNAAIDEELRRRFPPTTRRIRINNTDPMWPVVRDRILDSHLRGEHPYSTILVTRKYSAKELSDSDRFQLILTRMFEPCGVDKGTVYDDSAACPKCGFGRVQRSPLRLNLRKVPKGVELAFTIARSEWIVSQRLAELMTRQSVASQDRLTGFRLEPVEHRGARPPEQKWYQLIVTGSAGHTVPPTRFGIDYLRGDPEGRFVCSEHNLSGLNLASEVYLDRRSVEDVDLAITTDREGMFGGVLMPTPVLVASPRFYRMLRTNGIQGYRVEVAHLV